ncbi:MAG: VOC family protein [Actinomycetota bacterium]|nr:VOC family protein [Actinomycetota bacterium]
MPHAHGAPSWIELFTPDPEGAKDFYGQLFGWTAEDSGPEYGGYILFYRNGQQIAGCMKTDESMGGSEVWSVYLAADDVAAVTESVRSHGGQVLVEPMQVGEMGHMAFFVDAGGAAVGAWQPLSHPGFATRGEVGTPDWFEVHTRDYGDTVDFYRDVFAWDAHVMSDTGEFRYTTLGEGEDSLAGIMDAAGFLPEGVPAHWGIYFRVEDTDAAVARVEELGGVVVAPPEDTPFGRVASVSDSTGVAFKVVARRP